ncbi:hypothetical protein BDQ17DRAFT_1219846, partial [Cyathus striatus]
FWKKYNEREELIGLKATLAMFIASNSKKIPWMFQLETTIALCTKTDTLVDVGTGYGKTFCMILPALLFP